MVPLNEGKRLGIGQAGERERSCISFVREPEKNIDISVSLLVYKMLK